MLALNLAISKTHPKKSNIYWIFMHRFCKVMPDIAKFGERAICYYAYSSLICCLGILVFEGLQPVVQQSTICPSRSGALRRQTWLHKIDAIVIHSTQLPILGSHVWNLNLFNRITGLKRLRHSAKLCLASIGAIFKYLNYLWVQHSSSDWYLVSKYWYFSGSGTLRSQTWMDNSFWVCRICPPGFRA